MGWGCEGGRLPEKDHAVENQTKKKERESKREIFSKWGSYCRGRLKAHTFFFERTHRAKQERGGLARERRGLKYLSKKPRKSETKGSGRHVRGGRFWLLVEGRLNKESTPGKS